MKLTEKLISENNRDEFSATSGKSSISPSPLRLTSMHFSDVIPASEKKKKNQIQRDSVPVTVLCNRDSRNKPEVDKGVKKEDMALSFGFPPNSLSTIIRNRDKLRN
ncbi:hypothetical protein TNCV_3044801 [Trichonephila clavipes]|nr:hypothetical protein TNCV_3044801 [Trichonephila clavipes]